MNWRYTVYNTVVSDIFIESDETLGIMLLENNVYDYKQLVYLKTKMTRKETRPKCTKDSNVNEKSKGWSRKGIKRYNNLIKVVRLGRMTEVSKENEIELKMKYTGMCGKSSFRNSLVDDGDPDDSDGNGLEAYDRFAGELTVINVERTTLVYINKYTLHSILY